MQKIKSTEIVKFSAKLSKNTESEKCVDYPPHSWNTSFKVTIYWKQYLVITWSGKSTPKICEFENSNEVLATIDLEELFKRFGQKIITKENEFKKLIQKCNSSEVKASTETGIHAILDWKYIIHTHNIYLMVLLCMKWWKKILKDLLKDYDTTILDYCAPWLHLFEAIKKKKEKKWVWNILDCLKNHGVRLIEMIDLKNYVSF